MTKDEREEGLNLIFGIALVLLALIVITVLVEAFW